MTSLHAERAARRRPLVLAGWILLAGVLALAASRLIGSIGAENASLPWGTGCVVSGESGDIGLTVDEARLATTAVVLQRRGLEAPDTSAIDPDVVRRLTQGPAGDAGPSLTCRASAGDRQEREQLTADGLTPRASELREAMASVFGELSVQYVIFDDLVWSVHASQRGWQDYASPDPESEILRHLDHVHVDVLRGA